VQTHSNKQQTHSVQFPVAEGDGETELFNKLDANPDISHRNVHLLTFNWLLLFKLQSTLFSLQSKCCSFKILLHYILLLYRTVLFTKEWKNKCHVSDIKVTASYMQKSLLNKK